MFLGSLVGILVLSLVQISSFELFSVKPNWVLAGLAAYALTESDWLRRGALVLTALFLVNPTISFSGQTITVGLVMILVIALLDYLPWHKPLSVLVAISLGVLILNMGPFSPGVYLLETLYTLPIAYLLYLLLSFSSSKLGVRRD